MLYSNNWTSLYSVAGINRLSIFILSVILISSQEEASDIYRGIFVSMLAGGVVAAFIGIAHQFINIEFFHE